MCCQSDLSKREGLNKQFMEFLEKSVLRVVALFAPRDLNVLLVPFGEDACSKRPSVHGCYVRKGKVFFYAFYIRVTQLRRLTYEQS